MDERPYGCSRRAVLAILVVFLAIFGCIGGLALGVDAACYSAMTKKIPLYPNARVTYQVYNTFRLFGLGETRLVLDSDDPVDEVRNWYGRTVGANTKAAQENHDPFFFLATGRWAVAEAEDGSGTQIILSGVCGY